MVRPEGGWPEKFCPICDTVTSWNSYDRCLTCQRRRSREYAARRKASGGGFSKAVRIALITANPDRCPVCSTLWSEVRRHEQHPRTPWHLDHDVSPQNGGTNDPRQL
jgi:hypothetical protein